MDRGTSSRRAPSWSRPTCARSGPGYNFGENAELFAVSYEVRPAKIAPGRTATSPATRPPRSASSPRRRRPGRPLFLGSYPITPASDILHELSALKHFDVFTFQAEDEIAGIGAALGAAFGGAIAITTTSGPGMALKAETIGLALAVELPLVVIDIQRGGPSTGMPTKTEQADLLHGDVRPPRRVAAARSSPPRRPADCFDDGVRGGAHRASST